MNDARLAAAIQLRRSGRLTEAARLYGEILQSEPAHYEALHALGLVTYQRGAPEEAERLIGRATEANPLASDAFYNRGCLLQKLERFAEAQDCFARAIALKPDYIEALVNSSRALTQLGRHAEALAVLERLVAKRPDLAEAWNNHGGALMALGRADESLASYEHALAIKPGFADARANRGNTLVTLGRFAEALKELELALTLTPMNADIWKGKGDTLAGLGRNEDARVAYDRALSLHVDHAGARFGLANALFEEKRYAEAADAYEKALAADAALPFALGQLCIARRYICDWRHADRDEAALKVAWRDGKPAAQPFYNALLSDSPEDQQKSAAFWVRTKCLPAEPLWHGERYTHERLRIAYVSADFGAHPVSRMLAGIIEHHDRSRFEPIAIALAPDDGSTMRRRLESAFAQCVDADDRTDADIARLMRDMEVDVAVDLMGFTAGSRPAIFASRPAPVQANWLGFPGTMAAPFMDYVIADACVLPAAEQRFYDEAAAWMPRSFMPADRARAIAPAAPVPEIPDGAFVFCCFNGAQKITPAVFAIWMRLLHAVSASVLWLSDANPVAKDNLLSVAAAAGIEAGRLIFAPFLASEEQHLARLGRADLFLDTLPFAAHSTAVDCLWAGVPLITCVGRTFAGRVAASVLSAAGMDELIAGSLAGYEALALNLALDKPALRAVKTKLAAAREISALFDTAGFTARLEEAFLHMQRRAHAGLPPASFSVPAALP